MAVPRYLSYLVSRGIARQPYLGGIQIQRLGPPGWGLGVRLTTSPCKKKFVENLLRRKRNPRTGSMGCGGTYVVVVVM
jgi:hypothetical protein